MIYANPINGDASEGATAPDGYTLQFDTAAAYDAWRDANFPPPPPPPVTYTRDDYKRAIDDMLQAQAEAHEYDDIASAASYAARAGAFQQEGIWYYDLRDFVWSTSKAMASAPPTEGPTPTPEQLAAYLLGAYVATHPFPGA